MRLCQQCNKPDRLTVDPSQKCLCKPGTTTDEDAASHHDDCPKLCHYVVRWLRVIRVPYGLSFDTYMLSPKETAEGWKKIVNGSYLFKFKVLCPDCIGIHVQREELHKEYLRACAKSGPKREKSYTDILTSNY